MQTMKDRGRQAGADASPRYAQVWGDTVDTTHLGWSVLIGAVVSFGAFELALRVLQPLVAQAAMGRAYAMLVGLGGCLAAGGLCARLFKPKRIVVEQEESDEGMRAELIERLVGEAGPQGSVRLLPDCVAAEMKEAGLYDLFAGAEARHAGAEATIGHVGSRGVA